MLTKIQSNFNKFINSHLYCRQQANYFFFPFYSESSEVVYWAVGLIHEFVVNNIAMEEICSVPILLKSLYRVLVSSEANLQRLVLRILRYLSEYSEKFKTSVIHHKQLLARLPICLASGDEDLVSWSPFLIHEIAKTGLYTR